MLGEQQRESPGTSTGWLVTTYPDQYEVRSLDEALAVLAVLPDHHRTRRCP